MSTHIRNVIYPSLDVLSSNSYLVYPFEWSFSLWYRQARKDFITAKYTEKRFARRKCPDGVSKLHTLCDAVKSRDIFSLIQVYAEGVDLMEPIPLANGHVSLHALPNTPNTPITVPLACWRGSFLIGRCPFQAITVRLGSAQQCDSIPTVTNTFLLG